MDVYRSGEDEIEESLPNRVDTRNQARLREIAYSRTSVADNEGDCVPVFDEKVSIPGAIEARPAGRNRSKEDFSQISENQQQANEPREAEVNDAVYPGEEDNSALKPKERSVVMILRAWLIITRRVLPSSTLVFVFMWIYYIPALILPVNTLCAVSPILYVHVREIFARSFNILSYAMITRETYGYELSKSTVNIYCPVILAFYLMYYTIETIFQFTTPVLISVVILPLIIYSIILHIFYDFKKSNQGANVIENLKDFRRDCIKSGKLIVVCMVAFVSFQVIIPLFTRANFIGKIIVRFIIFPIISFIVNNYQLIIVGENIRAYKKYVVPVTYIRYLLQFTSRSMLTSLNHDPLSFIYILFCFCASIAQIINRLTIKKQQIISRIVFDWTTLKANDLMKFLPSRPTIKPQRVSSCVNIENPDNFDANLHAQDKHGSRTVYNEDLREIRAIHIIEGVKIDIQTMISTPVLFYFLHRLFEDKGITLMKSPTEVMLQITIQLLFEIVTNSLLFFYEHYYLNLPILHELDKEGYINHAFRFICQICALFYLHYIFYSFY